MNEEQDLLPMPEWQAHRVDALRAQMREAGCVFDFTVRRMDMPVQKPSERLHRALLGVLFREVSERGPGKWTPRVDLAAAHPTLWPSECVTDPKGFLPKQRIDIRRDRTSISHFEWLFQAFDDPPYGARCEMGLFAEFCEVVGLWPNHEIEVWDWVGDPNVNPGRSDWCDYFDQGKEWWGIWCLTVWNPRNKTLAALAASSTD